MATSNTGRMFTWDSLGEIFISITNDIILIWRNDRFNIGKFKNRELSYWVEVV